MILHLMDGSGQANAERDALHDQFCHLLALLIFATGYNSDGFPQLRDPEHTYQINDDEDTLYRKLTSSAILNALTTFCVCSHKVFAIVNMVATGVLVVMELERGSIPAMNSTSSLKDSHHDNEKVPKHCRLLAKGHLLEVDVKVEDDEWWNLCIEKQG
jgi:hypothetical protein